MRYLNAIGGPSTDPRPEPAPPERITLRLPAELAKRLDAKARERGVTRSDVVREVLERELTPAAEKHVVTVTMHAHADWDKPAFDTSLAGKVATAAKGEPREKRVGVRGCAPIDDFAARSGDDE